jgi:predicted nucleic acid-binding protein
MASASTGSRSTRLGRPPRSLVNDILIALTCQENGITLITDDSDFKVIRAFMRGFAFIGSWPA